MFGEIFDGHAAAEGAVVQLHCQVFQGQAAGRALQAGHQLQLGEGGRVIGGRQRVADAFKEGAQAELGDGQAAAQLGCLVQITQVQLTEGAQLVGRNFQAVPRGDIGGQVDQQLALCGEGHGLAAGRLTRGLARQAHVFEVVAFELAVEAQLAGQLGTGLDVRLAGADEGAGLERNVCAFMDWAGAQLDAFGAVAVAGLGIGVLHARVVHGQAVNVQLDGAVVAVAGRRRLLGLCRCLCGCIGACAILRGQRLADVLPIAMALFVTRQGQVQALDTYVAHLHFAA